MTRQDAGERKQRVLQLLELLDREQEGLERTRSRLFGQTVNADWVRGMEQHPEREDLAESFAAKFNRFQDGVGDKLLPRVLDQVGEPIGPFIDNLDRAERLGWLHSAARWMRARRLRNRLVHEYVPDPAEFARALQEANELADDLLATRKHLESVFRKHAE